jgi:hypothetical protein
MKLPKSKRLRFTAVGLGVNFITVWIGVYFNVDLVALGTCLSLINAPLYVYVFGDSFRPSNLTDIDK